MVFLNTGKGFYTFNKKTKSKNGNDEKDNDTQQIQQPNIKGANMTRIEKYIEHTSAPVSTLDEKAKEVFDKAGLGEGEVLYYKGINELVSKHFTDTSGIMSSRWIITWFTQEIVWVVEMTRRKPSAQTKEWVNVYNGDEIIEIMPLGKTTFMRSHVRTYAKAHPYRIVVEKINGYMIVHGVYKFDERKSVNDKEHYYTKI